MSPNLLLIFVLGPPAAGKGTLCGSLTGQYAVQHMSVGDVLRKVATNNNHPSINQKLEKQELINAEELLPILKDKLSEAGLKDPERRVMLIDGFPRSKAQGEAFEAQYLAAPQLVQLFRCDKEVARKRYLDRKRGKDDDAMFEKRYHEYEIESEAIESAYGKRGLVLEVQVDTEILESWDNLQNLLAQDQRWKSLFVR
ncbi:hypothetical protein HYALB_00002209 [Hymenoscyphus albidus]|uniref:P-loop containing nucleoside triphosphate hydrolase protein n=1 Tax=Hymenoscyphus albidus TaxID=595503 RepID=A0A9N9LGK1_9HELO|nr:hypothetical protein HYALB_00002209 [Hymenoscyphus albidus]